MENGTEPKATEEGEKDSEVGNTKAAAKVASHLSDNPASTAEDILAARKKQKAACSEEINAILQKYGCDFSARVLVTENGNFPQVFIVDAKPKP